MPSTLTGPNEVIEPVVEARQRKVKFMDVIRAVMTETDCDELTATRVVNLLGRARHARRKLRYTYHLTNLDMHRCHDVLDVIMPDDVKMPMAGSAHDLANRFFLVHPELTYVHLKDGKNLEYCGVEIDVVTLN
jgi:hypothetical protein